MSLLPFKFKDEVKLDFLSITNALLVKVLFVYICIDLYLFILELVVIVISYTRIEFT